MKVLCCFVISCVVLPLIAAETLKFHPKSLRNKGNWKMTDGELETLVEQYLFSGKKATNLKNFIFKDGSNNDNSSVSVKISPDPIFFPGNISICADLDIKQPISDSVTVALKVKKKVGAAWIDLPCTANIGSCTYTNLCSSLATVTSQCQQELKADHDLCQCPIKAETYKGSCVNFEVDATFIPTGDYDVQAHATYGTDGKYFHDIEVQFSVSS
ncbi:ganglioside GM2 activator-like [Argopecten irradians]|uniref:ganglioside GM2 activator-like n=1 Tax=Argopecten irradians TaxID=31199 RepID=UPI0037120E78